MAQIALSIYVVSIATILYRMWQKREVTRAFVMEDGDIIDWVFVLILVFCPVLNTLFAIAAFVAIYEGED